MSREIDFVVLDGALEMHVIPRRGRPYTHRCSRQVYEEVAHDVEAAPRGVTIEEVRHRLELPHTQVAVALAFMKERGCVEVRRRRTHPASRAMFEDAMVEYLALEHGAAGAA